MDTKFIDKALKFAIDAHSGTPRRGTNVPYTVHIMDAYCIASSMTDDFEILAAAILHDTVEDTSVTYEDLTREFSQRVSDLVKSESDESKEDDPSLSWMDRKIAGINRIKNGSRDEQIVALADKLSNLRAMYRDYTNLGLKFWERFHESDPKVHKWRFLELLKSFDKVTDTIAYKEFKSLIRRTFSDINVTDAVLYENNTFTLNGNVTKELFLPFEKYINNKDLFKFDCTNTLSVTFEFVHYLINYGKEEYRFQFVNCNKKVFDFLVQTGLAEYFSILKLPREYSLENHEEYGEGYTSLVYTTKDHDSIAKVYRKFVPLSTIEAEKLASTGVAALGFDTPLSGEIIKVDDLYGITFEQIEGKKSIARSIADDPDNIEMYVKEFAKQVYKLHHTKCKKSYFGDVKERYLAAIDRCGWNDENKQRVKELLNEVSNDDVCSHGDCHIGNMIRKDDRYMFIDLADFAYGSHYFDIGTMYFLMNRCDKQRFEDMFHFDISMGPKVWDIFVKEYYKDFSKEELEKELKLIHKYSGFQMCFFFSRGEWNPEKEEWVLSTLFGE